MGLTFQYDQAKAYNLARYFIKTLGGSVEILKLMKLIFLAERLHFARYGQPITGDSYAAMPLGPVPSSFYDEIKKPDEAPLVGFTRSGNSVSDNCPELLDMDEFGRSEQLVMNEVLGCFGQMSSMELAQYTHENITSWQKNYALAESVGTKSWSMPYEEFLETGESREFLDELIEIHKELSI